MKRIRKAPFFSLMLSLVFFLNLTIPVENMKISNKNIEALADVENNKCFCVDVGSLDCPISTEKVKYVR